MTVVTPKVPSNLTTARDILEKTHAYFNDKGIATARLDAEVLLAEALGYSRLQLYLNLDRPLDARELDHARGMVRRRAVNEPVAYILGRKEFAGRDFKVGPGVLIPRPDTEILVEEAGRELRARFGGEAEAAANDDSAVGSDESDATTDAGPLRILEFGIGSGAIAVSLAADNSRIHATATEINDAAAQIAHENAATHGVDNRIEILRQPNFDGIVGVFHAIVSNPPYIAVEEKPGLAADVVNYEPGEALFAEDGGLQWYRFLAKEAPQRLAPDGFVVVEIGYTQREAVEAIFRNAGLELLRSVKDYAGNDRVVMAQISRKR